MTRILLFDDPRAEDADLAASLRPRCRVWSGRFSGSLRISW